MTTPTEPTPKRQRLLANLADLAPTSPTVGPTVEPKTLRQRLHQLAALLLLAGAVVAIFLCLKAFGQHDLPADTTPTQCQDAGGHFELREDWSTHEKYTICVAPGIIK